jgi:putative heme iron utilization protein
MQLDPREARALLRRCGFAALATQSIRLPGYPFLSHVAIGLDGACQPLMLLSRLAEHSRNLDADARASLMVTLPQHDAQAQPRLTLVGDIAPFEPAPALAARYLRYHPDGADYLGFGDFRFFRMHIAQLRLIGGFAKAGWMSAADFAPRALAEEAEGCLLEALAPAAGQSRLLGVDWEGLDLIGPDGARGRRGWPTVPTDEAALKAAALTVLQAASAAG